MGHLHMNIKRPQSTRQKTTDTDLEDKTKTNVDFFATVDPNTTKEVKFYSDLCGRFPTTPNRGNKYIYIMHVYDCNSIQMIAMNNRSDKEIIRAFIELNEYLKKYAE